MLANYNDGTQFYLTDVPMKSYCTTIFRSSKLYLSTHIIVFQLLKLAISEFKNSHFQNYAAE